MGFVAGKRIDMGDGRFIEIGEPVPEAAEWKNWRAWVGSGHLLGYPDPVAPEAPPPKATKTATGKSATVSSGTVTVLDPATGVVTTTGVPAAVKATRVKKAKGGAKSARKGKAVADKNKKNLEKKADEAVETGAEMVPHTSPDLNPEADVAKDVMPGDASGGTPAATPKGRLRMPVQGDVLESEAASRGETLEEVNKEMEEQQKDVAPSKAEQKPKNAQDDER